MQNAVTGRLKARSGTQIRIRRLTPNDAPYLVDMFENLSQESRYLRFQQTYEQHEVDRLWHEAEAIVGLIGERSEGLIAFADLPDHPNAPVAAARFVHTAAGEAEAAITVIDAFQREGIGTELMLRLARLAKLEGIRRIVGLALNENRGLWSLLRRLPYEITRQPEGNATMFAVHLDRTTADETLEIADLKRH